MTSVRCKKCDIKFKGMSELRKHQWLLHREIYKNLMAAAHKPRVIKKAQEIKKAKKSLKALVTIPNGTQELSARALLDKLREQQSFLNNTVALIAGIIHQEEKK